MEEETLQIRSPGTAQRYLGEALNCCAALMASWTLGIASRSAPGAITSWAGAAGSSTSGV